MYSFFRIAIYSCGRSEKLGVVVYRQKLFPSFLTLWQSKCGWKCDLGQSLPAFDQFYPLSGRQRCGACFLLCPKSGTVYFELIAISQCVPKHGQETRVKIILLTYMVRYWLYGSCKMFIFDCSLQLAESLVRAIHLSRVLNGGNLSQKLCFMVPTFMIYAAQLLQLVLSKYLAQVIYFWYS